MGEASGERARARDWFRLCGPDLHHVIEWIDDRVDYEEVRIRAVGTTGTDILHVVYTDRGNVRRIISARIASRKERKKWLAEPLNK